MAILAAMSTKRASAAFNPEAPKKMKNGELDARNGIIAEARRWRGAPALSGTAGA
jgi:hypothetical protein